MRISVIIRCLNEGLHIGRLLTGMMEQTEKDVEIIVVDSGSTDDTLRIASSFPTKILHIRKEAFSFGRALNIGCAAATGDILVLASAHVYPVYNDWLTRMAAPFQDPTVGIAYGKQRGDHRTQYSEHRIFAATYPDRSRRLEDHPFCNNANAAVRRTLWAAMPYDETLTGLEDIDLAHRAMRHGHAVVYESEATIVHVHEETPARIRHRYFREAMALRRILPDERFTLWDFLRLWPANTLSDLREAARESVLSQWATRIAIFRTMQFWGTYRGWQQRGELSRAVRQRLYYPGEEAGPAIEDSTDGDTPSAVASSSRQPIDYSAAR